MDINYLLKVAGIDFGIQWTVWAISSVLKTEKFYDLTGALTFISLGAFSLLQNDPKLARQKILTGMLTAWASRLGFFLFSRILRDKVDKRFHGVRDKPSIFFIYWSIQAVWIFLSGLPTYLVNGERRDPPWQWSDYLGWTIWTTGFIIEAVADQQKSNFHKKSENKDKFITHGLWKYSRHPNYFGEILMSFGQYLSAFASLGQKEAAFGLLSPIFVSYLLTRVSGIPLLEKQAEKRWKGNLEYNAYKKRTSVLILMPPNWAELGLLHSFV